VHVRSRAGKIAIRADAHAATHAIRDLAHPTKQGVNGREKSAMGRLTSIAGVDPQV
jgi:hypothetical protein